MLRLPRTVLLGAAFRVRGFTLIDLAGQGLVTTFRSDIWRIA
jgi:hypothetical protein